MYDIYIYDTLYMRSINERCNPSDIQDPDIYIYMLHIITYIIYIYIYIYMYRYMV